jgi:hypothetical protein
VRQSPQMSRTVGVVDGHAKTRPHP